MIKNKLLTKTAALCALGVLTAGLLAGCSNEKNSDKEVYKPILPTAVEEADIYVEPIEGLSDDFIKGMDISTLIVEEESGVVYYNEDGEEEDLLKILADAGVNYIRVRVWNDPYDSDGNGYGGGNNDVDKAAEIGRRAAQYGMKLVVDFHYSDFWADPGKQQAPKAWAHLTFDDKKQAIYDFTKESLAAISDAGADIGMVQIGNEINNGLSGETDDERIVALLCQASAGVRDFSKDIQIVVHYTNIEDQKNILSKAQMLADGGVDYDVFGVSYYAFWHGTMDNLVDTLEKIKSEYGKETCIMETSYAYTLEDGDANGNSVGEADLLPEYGATVQSQATCIRDIMAAANEAGALGVFYWEGAWIPVGSEYESNSVLWEKYGSGWASSYAAKYDPDDAGQYYGGCAWDNQALFDFTGHPLASLNVFKYVNYGTSCEQKVDFIESCSVNVNVGEELVMPEKIAAIMNDRQSNDGVAVTWDAEQVAAIDTDVMADYVIDGTLEDGTEVTCNVKVAKINYVLNPGFEENNTSMWTVEYDNANPTDFQNKSTDAYSGDISFHFYYAEEFEFKVEQTVSGLAAGSYTLNTNIQGDAIGADGEIYLYAEVDGKIYQSEPVTLAGWVNWQTPEISDIELAADGDIKIGVYVKSGAGGWGTIDDFYLYKQ